MIIQKELVKRIIGRKYGLVKINTNFEWSKFYCILKDMHCFALFASFLGMCVSVIFCLLKHEKLVCFRIRFASMSPQGPNMLLKKDGRKIPTNSTIEHGTTASVCKYGAQVLNYSECCSFPRWVLEIILYVLLSGIIMWKLGFQMLSIIYKLPF